jgi:hypothetical protein
MRSRDLTHAHASALLLSWPSAPSRGRQGEAEVGEGRFGCHRGSGVGAELPQLGADNHYFRKNSAGASPRHPVTSRGYYLRSNNCSVPPGGVK